MADWTPTDFNLYLPGEPWTSSKATAGPENLLAAFEGAPGAPRLAGIARGGSLAGAGNGTISGLGLVKQVLVAVGGTNNSTNGVAQAQIRFSNDGGATFEAYQNLFIIPATDVGADPTFRYELMHIDLETGAMAGGSTLTVPTNVDALQIRINNGALSGPPLVLIDAGRP